MTGNNIMSLFLNIIIYVFIGIIIIPFLLPIFPLLAILIVVVLLITITTSVINYFRFGMARAQTRRKFDEFGNRKTKATIVEMNETEAPHTEQIGHRDNHK